MSIHIGAPEGAIAPRVLLPGDPLRARFIAEKYLDNAVCYNEVRGMYGYTGTYKGVAVSVQGTGMGMPSHSIYVHELINSYGAKTLIRVGSCGAIQPEVKLRDLILALSASTNSSMVSRRFEG
ncbi:MAG: purine-nucleoside phosphorylase, partial [Spirochaetes bacterium]